MSLKTKKIIAREGLIIVGFLFVVGILFLIEDILKKTQVAPPVIVIDSTFLPDEPNRYTKIYNLIYGKGFCVLVFGYPIYLLIRFIFWAIKTLKQKEYK